MDGDAAGLERPLLETVRAPAWGRDGRRMYALAARGSTAYGLFSKADGADAAFARLADLGAAITALDLHDGARVVVATSKMSQWERQAHAQILLLNPATGAVTDLPLAPHDAAGSFSRLAAPAANRVFALHSSGRIIRWDGAAWQDTAGGGFAVFEADPRPGSRRLFAATDTAVFVSDDDGASWAAASRGLPACPHCCDLRIADDGKGGQILVPGDARPGGLVGAGGLSGEGAGLQPCPRPGR